MLQQMLYQPQQTFVQCLIALGHSLFIITPKLLQAASMIDNRNTKPISHTKINDPDNTLFSHWKFHPIGIKNHVIQNIYKKLGNTMTALTK
jgi:hypothetical protein